MASLSILLVPALVVVALWGRPTAGQTDGVNIGEATLAAGSIVSGTTTGAAGTSLMHNPMSCTYHPDGRIFIADKSNSRMVVISTDNVMTLVMSNLADIRGVAAKPDSSVIYYTTINHVRMINANSYAESLIIDEGHAAGPFGIDVYQNAFLLWVNHENGQLRRRDLNSGLQITLINSVNLSPIDVALTQDVGRTFTSCIADHRVYENALGGTGLAAKFGNGAAGAVDGVGTAAQLNTPRGLDVSSDNAYLYIADYGNRMVRRADLSSLATVTVFNQIQVANVVTAVNSLNAAVPYTFSVCAATHRLELGVVGNHAVLRVDMEPTPTPVPPTPVPPTPAPPPPPPTKTATLTLHATATQTTTVSLAVSVSQSTSPLTSSLTGNTTFTPSQMESYSSTLSSTLEDGGGTSACVRPAGVELYPADTTCSAHTDCGAAFCTCVGSTSSNATTCMVSASESVTCAATRSCLATYFECYHATTSLRTDVFSSCSQPAARLHEAELAAVANGEIEGSALEQGCRYRACTMLLNHSVCTIASVCTQEALLGGSLVVPPRTRTMTAAPTPDPSSTPPDFIAALRSTIRLLGSSFDQLLGDAGRRADLSAAIRLDLSRALGVDASHVLILNWWIGSLNVDFAIDADAGEAPASLLLRLNSLPVNWLASIQSVYSAVSSEVLTSEVLTVETAAPGVVTPVPSPNATPPVLPVPTAPSSSSSSDGTPLLLIILIVVGTVAGVLIIGAIILISVKFCRRGGADQPQEQPTIGKPTAGDDVGGDGDGGRGWDGGNPLQGSHHSEIAVMPAHNNDHHPAHGGGGALGGGTDGATTTTSGGAWAHVSSPTASHPPHSPLALNQSQQQQQQQQQGASSAQRPEDVPLNPSDHTFGNGGNAGSLANTGSSFTFMPSSSSMFTRPDATGDRTANQSGVQQNINTSGFYPGPGPSANDPASPAGAPPGAAAAAAYPVSDVPPQPPTGGPPGPPLQIDIRTPVVGAMPAPRVFKRSPIAPDAAQALTWLLAIRTPPPNRPDLQAMIPDDDDCRMLLNYIEDSLPEMRARPAVQALIRDHGLTDDDIRILFAYKLEQPYPVYRWLNGFLASPRRDTDVVQRVGPAFTMLYRALEKLPARKGNASRAAIVRDIPALRATFDQYESRLAPGSALSFWGFSSFSTDAKVINSEVFIGKPEDDAIVYACGALAGVDMEPFKQAGAGDERELLPLCPAAFTVTAVTKIGHKVSVTLEQRDHADLSYVVPVTDGGSPRYDQSGRFS